MSVNHTHPSTFETPPWTHKKPIMLNESERTERTDVRRYSIYMFPIQNNNNNYS